jgi:hypothetical protein
MFLFVAPALAAIAALPLTAPLRPIRVTLPLFCTPWPYTVTLFEQLVEFRLYPVLAILFLLVSFVLLFGGRAGVRRAQLPFFVGFGFLGFALFRFVLYGVYRGMPVWADFWEEATEFLAVFGVGVFLVVFRGQIGLFASRGPTSTTAASGAGGGGSPEAARGG